MKFRPEGFLIFLVITLIPIHNIQACSYELPNSLFLWHIHRTEDPNRPIVEIYNYTKHVTDVILDIENQRLTPLKGEEKKPKEGLPGSAMPYISELAVSNEQIHWVLLNPVNKSTFLDVLIPEGVDPLFKYTYFISERLNRAYLIIYTWLNKATTVIISLLDSSVIKLEKDVTLRPPRAQHVYDEEQILYMAVCVGDCVAGAYYYYNETSIKNIATYYEWESYYLDLRSSNLISVNLWVAENNSGVKIINYKTNEITGFHISVEDIKSVITPTTSSRIVIQPYLVLLALVTIVFFTKHKR